MISVTIDVPGAIPWGLVICNMLLMAVLAADLGVRVFRATRRPVYAASLHLLDSELGEWQVARCLESELMKLYNRPAQDELGDSSDETDSEIESDDSTTDEDTDASTDEDTDASTDEDTDASTDEDTDASTDASTDEDTDEDTDASTDEDADANSDTDEDATAPTADQLLTNYRRKQKERFFKVDATLIALRLANLASCVQKIPTTSPINEIEWAAFGETISRLDSRHSELIERWRAAPDPQTWRLNLKAFEWRELRLAIKQLPTRRAAIRAAWKVRDAELRCMRAADSPPSESPTVLPEFKFASYTGAAKAKPRKRVGFKFRTETSEAHRLWTEAKKVEGAIDLGGSTVLEPVDPCEHGLGCSGADGCLGYKRRAPAADAV
jgi:hypothetical protein